MRFLKIVFSELSSASRDRRELQTVMDLGAEALVIAKHEKEGISPGVDGADIHYITTRPLGEHAPASLNRFVALFSWARYARKLKPDVISGHDLPGLTSAWIATWFIPRRKRPLLVYDAHEFEIGRERRSTLMSALVRHYERFLMKRCFFSIVVNDAIADEMAAIHRLRTRLIVARNIPPLWGIDDAETARTRHEICSALNVPDNTFVAMYHGMVSPARGVDLLLDAAARVNDMAVIVLGNGPEDYLNSLHSKCDELGISGRVLFHAAVPNKDLWKYVSAADVGVIAIKPLVKNSLLSLPNKLFENIQSLTPVIVSDMPTQSELVRKYDIGLIFRSESADDLAEKLEQMRSDPALYARFKEHLVAAKCELCWENEKNKLIEAYSAAFDNRRVLSRERHLQ